MKKSLFTADQSPVYMCCNHCVLPCLSDSVPSLQELQEDVLSKLADVLEEVIYFLILHTIPSGI